jgi:hypothetical protein
LNSFIRFLDELEHNKTFLFLKNEKIEDSPLKNQADGQPILNGIQAMYFFHPMLLIPHVYNTENKFQAEAFLI